MTHLDLWHEGGPVFWVIVFTGLASVAVFLERLLHLRRARIHYADFLEGVFNILAKGNVREAQALCDEAPGPVAHLMRMAITNRDEPREVLRQVLDNAGHAEISRMERRLGVLATIVQIAPLLGLLGSLLGVLETVLVLRSQAPLVQSVDVTGGLVRALIASIAGLMVAVPAHAMFNLLAIRIDRIVLDMEQASSDILSFMGRRTVSGGLPERPQGG
ncbi:MAG: MotA/TolQ/ExbB proton channel family protein [Lentisphaerae bacterium]|jgi:biopolymer transport protein ExbB|nr:MotA/TolQ/ExbB proton channel family protein [Lentisphaerota bacterium]